MTQYFVNEYENNSDEKLVEITSSQFETMTEEFKREQYDLVIEHSVDYSVSNNIKSIIELNDIYTITRIVHQDSERDIFIVE
jgi:hypothetical protein